MEGETIRLKDGRQLGYCDYGKPDGIPLMLFHGTPGARLMPSLETAAWIDELGLRVITPERPGFGVSDPAPGRSIADWAQDVEALADYLGLDRYHVSGGSGGGPYALACALHAPDRVRSVTLIASGGPPEVMPITRQMQIGNRVIFFCARYLPFLARRLLNTTARSMRTKPDKVKAAMVRQLSATKQSMGEEIKGDTLLKIMQEAYRQGGDGAYCDLRLVARDWGLDLSAIKVPVFLWHGTTDTLVPVSTGRGLAALIPGCEARFIPEGGHLLLSSKDVAFQIMQRLTAVGT